MKNYRLLFFLSSALILLSACRSVGPMPETPAGGANEQISVRNDFAISSFLRRPIDEMPDITNGKNYILPPDEAGEYMQND